MRTTKMTGYVKKGRTWVPDGYEVIADTKEGEAAVYERLSSYLVSKYIHKASWVKNIKRTNLYDGTQKIVITQDNDFRMEFIIPE